MSLMFWRKAVLGNDSNVAVTATDPLPVTLQTAITAAEDSVSVFGTAASAFPAAAADGAIKAIITDLFGRLFTAAEAPNELLSAGQTANITDTTATTALGVAGASTKWRITAIGIYNSDDVTGTWVKVQDDTAVTPVVYWRGYAAAVGGGFNLNFSPPLPAVGQVNGKVNVLCETTGATVAASICAFKTPA